MGLGEKGGVSNLINFLVSVTASLHWQHSGDDMAGPSVSGGGAMWHSYALNETRENEGVNTRNIKGARTSGGCASPETSKNGLRLGKR